ncbi:MAG TPA: hypothetical protein VHM70_15770 [Polyangiaceae bacterium]|nr:hypothetical protein [Polyangiaceae bacterium]
MNGGAAPIAVDSAPPPARIDTVQPEPDPECAWADGQWRWEDNRWQWQAGNWVRVAPDCYYADALMIWVATQTGKGILFYTHGQWYQRAGGLCPTPPVCANDAQ